MKLIKKNSKKGFTLVELVIVIAILAILALILVPAVAKYVGNAEKSKNEASIRTIYSSAITEVASAGDELSSQVDSDKLKEGSIMKAIRESSNLKDAGELTVEIDKGTVKSVTYTTTSGETLSFDGVEMTYPKKDSGDGGTN